MKCENRKTFCMIGLGLITVLCVGQAASFNPRYDPCFEKEGMHFVKIAGLGDDDADSVIIWPFLTQDLYKNSEADGMGVNYLCYGTTRNQALNFFKLQGWEPAFGNTEFSFSYCNGQTTRNTCPGATIPNR